jgi:hypothetical protein
VENYALEGNNICTQFGGKVYSTDGGTPKERAIEIEWIMAKT